jgi:hypothetical protein
MFLSNNPIPIVTEWQSYTATIAAAGTVTNSVWYWRRNGDSIDITGRAQAGTPTGSTFSVTLPNSWTVDANKHSSSYYFPKGNATTSNTTGSNVQQQPLITGGSNFIFIGYKLGTNNQYTPAVGTAFMTTNDQFAITVLSIPITGLTTYS